MRHRRAVFVVLTLLAVMPRAARSAAQATVFPDWLSRRADVLAGAREALIDDRRALFDAAPPRADASGEDAVLLCRVRVENPTGDGRRRHGGLLPELDDYAETRWDLFADPDLRVTLTLGRHRAVAWGTENTDDEVVSFAGVDLSPGASLRFRVVDRDVTYDEPIGSVTLAFDGALPIRATQGYVAIECRTMDPALVARRRQDALARATAAILAAEGASPDLASPDIGAPRIEPAEAALVELAAYAGAREESVRAQVARLRAAQARFEGLARSSIRAARRTAPARGDSVDVSGHRVAVIERVCGARDVARRFPMVDAESTSCVVVVSIDPLAASPAIVLGAPDLLDANGVASASNGVFIDPVAPSRAVIGFAARVTRDMLLRVGVERRTLLSLR